MTVLLVFAVIILAIFITSLFFANRKNEWEQMLEDEAQADFLASLRKQKEKTVTKVERSGF